MHMNDEQIIQHVVAQLQSELGTQLLGVLAGGSRLRGEGNLNSDLDLVVVIEGKRRRRKNIVADGVEVEMFFNPPFQMRRYFEEDRNSGRGLMPHLVSTGQICYDPRGVLAELQAEAQTIWAAGPAPLSLEEQQWRLRYAFADMLRDISDVVDDEEQATYLIGGWLPHVMNNYYRIQGRWLVKPKRVFRDLSSWDAPAAELARRATTGSARERYAAFEALVEHTLTSLGGPMPLEWQSEWEELQL